MENNLVRVIISTNIKAFIPEKNTTFALYVDMTLVTVAISSARNEW